MTFWRVRMKVGGWHERSEDAWDQGIVGVWYGAWTADEWRGACTNSPGDPWSLLRLLPHQERLGWKLPPDIAAVRRLEAIDPDDRVVVFLCTRNKVGLAKLEPELQSDKLNSLNEIYEDGTFGSFKFHRLRHQKTFPLAELPDAYRLLPSQGRGNLHQFHGMRGHVQLLADHSDAEGVRRAIGEMPFDKPIDLLGASAWESVCTAYLTLEYGFVPTGLRTGSTLPIFDIVGRRNPDGSHILAQCKKNPSTVDIPDEFLFAIGNHAGNSSVFYFAFGGCRGLVPPDVKVIGRKEILA